MTVCIWTFQDNLAAHGLNANLLPCRYLFVVPFAAATDSALSKFDNLLSVTV